MENKISIFFKIKAGKHKGKWAIGPRSAWDDVVIGPFDTKKEAAEYYYGVNSLELLNK